MNDDRFSTIAAVATVAACAVLGALSMFWIASTIAERVR